MPEFMPVRLQDIMYGSQSGMQEELKNHCIK